MITKDELIRIARIWGYDISIEVTPNGTAIVKSTRLAGGTYGLPLKRTYGSLDYATHNVISNLKSSVLKSIASIEGELI